MSNLSIEYRDVSGLTEYDKNSRVHSDEHVQQVAASITEFGFTNPLLIDADGILIAGHGRLAAARELGMSNVPCIELGHLSDEQRMAYVIADNKLAENSDWNDDALACELAALSDAGYNLDILGFDESELAAIMVAEVGEGLTDEDEVPELPEKPLTVLGDVWILGNHRLMCGDSTSIDAVETLMDGSSSCFVFSDPPYGIDVVQSNQVGGAAPTKFGTADSSNIVESSTYSKIIGDETTETAKDFYNTCLSIGMKNILLWGGNYFTDFLYPSRCWVVWDKEMTGNFSQAEMAWTSFSKGGIKIFKHLWNGLSREGSRKEELSKRVHPTQKPVGLFVEIFKRFDGFTDIYDGFGGSGSTLIACEKTNRNCRMMELDPKYCDVIINRWQDYTGKQATLEATGEKYNNVKNARLN